MIDLISKVIQISNKSQTNVDTRSTRWSKSILFYFFHSEEELYKDRIDSSTGKLNGIPIAIEIMDFKFMEDSMRFVVCRKSPVWSRMLQIQL